MQPQPLIVVKNVSLSRDWYASTLGLLSGHGGDEYERMLFGDQLVLQLHIDDPQEHALLGLQHASQSHGIALWFQSDDFDQSLKRIEKSGATIANGPLFNENAKHQEIWLIDPDGYLVVIAGPYQGNA